VVPEAVVLGGGGDGDFRGAEPDLLVKGRPAG
jgi:hypothetical protein